jgi:hypothetical protein
VQRARVITMKCRTVETARTCHRDFLGAHRYTTRGGMCVLRRLLQRAKGENPLRSATLHYPFDITAIAGIFNKSPPFYYHVHQHRRATEV